MMRLITLALALSSARAGLLSPSYPLAYEPHVAAAAAPILHYEKSIPYNVPPFAHSVNDFQARSIYGVPAYAATPVAHSAGPVAQVSSLIRSPAPLDVAHNHFHAAPVSYAAAPSAPLPVAHAAPLGVAHAAPYGAPYAVAHSAPLPVAHAAPLALKAHHPLSYAAAPYAYTAGVAHPYSGAPLHHNVAAPLYGR